MGVFATVMAAAVLSGSTLGLPVVARLNGARTDLSAFRKPAIVLFWRSDCAACLIELSDLAALEASAGAARVIPIGLQPSAALHRALARLGLHDSDSLQALEDPARLLVRLGGAPPRLPLAVAFRTTGEICGRRSGLLGRNQVHAWAVSCGGADAGR